MWLTVKDHLNPWWLALKLKHFFPKISIFFLDPISMKTQRQCLLLETWQTLEGLNSPWPMSIWALSWPSQAFTRNYMGRVFLWVRKHESRLCFQVTSHPPRVPWSTTQHPEALWGLGTQSCSADSDSCTAAWSRRSPSSCGQLLWRTAPELLCTVRLCPWGLGIWGWKPCLLPSRRAQSSEGERQSRCF